MKLTVDVSVTANGFRIVVPGLLVECDEGMDSYRLIMGKLKAVEILLAAIDTLQGTGHLTGPVSADTIITRSQ